MVEPYRWSEWAHLDAGPERHQIGLPTISSRTTERTQYVLFSFQLLAILTSQALRAVMIRKESFLSLPNWLTVPFQINPKDVFHRLLGLVFELCSILKAFDKEKELSSPGNGVLSQLTLDCQHYILVSRNGSKVSKPSTAVPFTF
jgi:hypothetical protein